MCQSGYFFYGNGLGTMQNLIGHFLPEITVCLRVSASEMYQLFLHSSLGTMQNLISHFLLKNTVCLRVSASEMY
jgi:hypothetical protein